MPSKGPSKGKIRVLLCDDHALVREGTKRLLEGEPDIEVVGEASDGFEAIELARKLSPDVIAMDVSMPRMNGIEATREIKRHFPDIFILALTAYDDFAYVSRLIENGASGYILKSVRSEELIQAIRATALGECILHPDIAREVFARIARRSGLLAEHQGEVSGDQSFRSEAGLPDGGLEHTGEGADRLLTAREAHILKLAAKGLSNKEIAFELSLSPRTVQSHLSSVFDKLGVTSRTQAVVAGLKQGIIKREDIEVNPDG
ncbi:MAG: response regulator [Bacillota bacterium]|jgi:DNA-binding NarL/FixJ family response regulator|nr:response regulator transcription factor [Candidatus Fermentithermobacillaceae bacterium]